LVFAADLHRYFKALDSRTGNVLWQIPLSAPIASYPISYAADGKQYIAVAVGGRTPGTAHLAELYPELKSPSGSNILMVFGLGE
jgi:alcohol dehydrogenase (cytochrome c)